MLLNTIRTTAFVSGVLFSITGFAQSEPAAEEIPEIEVKFFDDVILPIIENNCQGCHGEIRPAAGIKLTDYDSITGNASLINEQVSIGRMPFRNPDWKDTPEGTTLLYWLSKLEIEDDQSVN